MGFGDLRVINEDRIEAGGGFPMHPHRDMEIITYVIKGALQHRDTLGNSAVIRPGEVQTMSAGTGIRHSEANAVDSETHLLQIWILPNRQGLTPSYGQKSFEKQLQEKNWVLLISPDQREDSLSIQQDLSLWVGKLKASEQKILQLKKDRRAWIQCVKGELSVNGLSIQAGDGVGISQEGELKISSTQDSEILYFDLP
jgi:redox-sensitive bicupin YhaK (pirin superfamily)